MTMRGFNEVNGSGRLTERLVVVVDLIIDDGGTLFTLRNGVGFGAGFDPRCLPRPVAQRSRNYSFGGPMGAYGAYGTKIGVSAA